MIKRDLINLGDRLLEKTVDVALLLVYLNLDVPYFQRGKPYLYGKKIQEDFEQFNYAQVKRALKHLKQKGLIQYAKEISALPGITKIGLKKINSIIPVYDEKRVWDGQIYLVSYDFPVKRNNERNILRNYLKKIGCGMLQQSIWLTPYNPNEIIKKFVDERNLDDGLVLVSAIGRKGSIGGMTLQELMEKVYHLESLNSKYLQFIADVKSNAKQKSQLVIKFLDILAADPQLPFPLLLANWEGEKAYRLFCSLKENVWQNRYARA